ncbi:hypothetical protein D046_6592B, partial [Vibrio parahaemolyticus V-223/04]
ACKN